MGICRRYDKYLFTLFSPSYWQVIDDLDPAHMLTMSAMCRWQAGRFYVTAIEYVLVNSSNTKPLVFAVRLDSGYKALHSLSPSMSPILRFLVPTSVLYSSSSMHLHHPRPTDSNQPCQVNLLRRNLMKWRSGTPGHMKHRASPLRPNSKRCSKRIKFSAKDALLPRARETGWQRQQSQHSSDDIE